MQVCNRYRCLVKSLNLGHIYISGCILQIWWLQYICGTFTNLINICMSGPHLNIYHSRYINIMILDIYIQWRYINMLVYVFGTYSTPYLTALLIVIIGQWWAWQTEGMFPSYEELELALQSLLDSNELNTSIVTNISLDTLLMMHSDEMIDANRDVFQTLNHQELWQRPTCFIKWQRTQQRNLGGTWWWCWKRRA